MTLSEVAIRRPVLAVVLSAVIVLFGLVGFQSLGVREYPALDPPVVTVRTTYPGASPDVIASQITEPLEQSISGASGIRVISSRSAPGLSEIRVEFDLAVDMEAAANDVRDKVSVARRMLPDDVDSPIVEKADADAETLVFMTVQSDTKSIYDVAHVADTFVKERIQTIPGVSTVRLFGDKRYAMRLLLDPNRMTGHGVTVDDVQSAITRENVDLPAGRFEGATTDLGVRTLARLTTPEEFNDLTLKTEGGRTIKLRDVGRAELSAEEMRTMVKQRGKALVALAVIPQPNTNAIEIADEFYERFEQIEEVLPPEYEMEVGYDFTTYVRRSVAEVQETVVVAFFLVALIIFAFLRDARATLVPVLAIPVSIVSAFFVMYVSGFTINILTLLGIVLAIGLVCDDAIVMLESIYTKIEAGQTPLEAAIAGSREVYFAVISTTVALVAVFLPILFLDGLTGRLFREFGVVLAGAVVVSSFVALTLSPMMSRFLLKRRERPGRFHAATEPFFEGLTNAYRKSLDAFMKVRFVSVPIVLGVAGYVVWAGAQLPRELAPIEDRSYVRLSLQAPESAGFEYTVRSMDEVAALVDERVPEVYRSYAITGYPAISRGAQSVYLKPPSERQRPQAEIAADLAEEVSRLRNARVFPSQRPTIGSRHSGQPLQYVLQAPTAKELQEVLPAFLDRAEQRPELRFVDVDFKVNREEAEVSVDRTRAADLGVDVRSVARTLQFSLGDQRLGYFVQDGRQYQIISHLDRPFRNQPSDLADLTVRSSDGRLLSLDNLVSWDESVVPGTLYRYNRFASATVSAGLAQGYALGDGIAALDEVSASVLPESVGTALAGEAKEFAESSNSLVFAFLLALAVVYLVLAAQFESFVDPFMILLTVPLSLGGAVLALQLTGSSLNVFSQVGIIMLVGLVTKNGILIVEFANQKREAGLDRLDAAKRGAVERFRPILMTSLATILGVLPIALSLGSSSGSRQSLGIAVVGGLLGATALSLYVLPAVYSYLSRRRPESSDEAAETASPGVPQATSS